MGSLMAEFSQRGVDFADHQIRALQLGRPTRSFEILARQATLFRYLVQEAKVHIDACPEAALIVKLRMPARFLQQCSRQTRAK